MKKDDEIIKKNEDIEDDHDEEDYDHEHEEEDDDEEEHLDEDHGSPLTKKRKLIILGIIVTSIFLLWFMFRENEPDKTQDTKKSNVASKDVSNEKDIGGEEDDNIINQVVNTVGAENYGGNISVAKPDLPDTLTPPPLIVPSIPEPIQSKPVSIDDLPSNISLPDPVISSAAPTIDVPEPMPSIVQAPATDNMQLFAPPPSPSVAVSSSSPMASLGFDMRNDQNNNADDGRNSNMIAYGGGGGGPSNGGGGGGGMGIDPSNPMASAKGVVDSLTTTQKATINDTVPPAQTSANQIMATAYGRLDTLIAQGKVVDVVLETAINTDLKGTVRAIVSRDVYSEASNNVLIPKGSRVIGTYATSRDSFATRLDILWTRVMRNDGIDLMVDSNAVDNLGRNGASGDVDLRIIEAIRNALLVSSITVGTAAAAQKMVGDDKISVTQNQDGQVSVVSKPVDSAITDSAQQISQILSSAVKSITPTQPTIKIDQGTKLKIFVNKDIVFSRSIANLNKVRGNDN